MIASTILAVFFVPVFFLLLQGLSEWWKPLAGGRSRRSIVCRR